MPSIDFFLKRGLFFKREFLDRTTRDACSAQLCASASGPAEVLGYEPQGSVRPAIRHTDEIALAGDLQANVAQRIASLGPELAEHFRIALTGCEGPSFLVYRTGGFYRPHRDRASAEGDATARARTRRVSLVIFLNAMSSTPGPSEYAGGALTFYGLVGDPAWREYGFALDPAPGLLVAFRSEIVHEVTPVLAGERYTIVHWFSDESQS